MMKKLSKKRVLHFYYNKKLGGSNCTMYVRYIIVSSRLVSSQNSLSGKSAGAMRHHR